MLYPRTNSILNIWREYDTTEMYMMKPNDTVKQVKVKIRMCGEYLTPKHKFQTAKYTKNNSEAHGKP